MKNIWMNFEGDSWYERNKKNLDERKGKDFPILLIKLYNIKPKRALEIGGADGYRIAEINKLYQSEGTVIEPSQKAIKNGREKYPSVKFIHGTCNSVKTKETFDLIILNFVFHWIYRENLYSSIAAIDRMLEDKGYLIIGDFGTDFPIKRKYHHLKDIDFYTWKMPYEELFRSSGRYIEIAKLKFNHDTHSLSGDINIDNMGSVVLMKKEDSYLEM